MHTFPNATAWPSCITHNWQSVHKCSQYKNHYTSLLCEMKGLKLIRPFSWFLLPVYQPHLNSSWALGRVTFMCKCQRKSQIPTCICTKVLYLPESQKDSSLAGLCAPKHVYLHDPAVFVSCQFLLYSSYLSTLKRCCYETRTLCFLWSGTVASLAREKPCICTLILESLGPRSQAFRVSFPGQQQMF